ncbi:hypothetical protein AGDE_14980 [Angomonas deanei]|uniref:Uncharacterized protein n=1 Tax=Angomonas deanei TaxID=59799 RepID=A0A7G2CFL7_9TRYP|nr:hypothetical protein AGDE_14980 [Angomonas deanei]CAD2217483.1 hypothetical protein, conserved [Angomonas deanei]|eukprot:EPY19890.1 hypothetical protein AGDE_14980 [Angomonas deanei]
MRDVAGFTGPGDVPVQQIRKCPSEEMLFVLSNHTLTLWLSGDLTPLGVVETNVSLFCVLDPAPSSLGRRPRGEDSSLVPTTGAKREASAEAIKVCVCKNSDRQCVILEVEYDRPAGVRTVIRNRCVVPVIVVSLVSFGSVLCLGSGEGYSLLHVETGNSRPLLRSDGGQPPLSCIMRKTVYMTYGKSVCWTSVETKEKMHYSVPGNEVAQGMVSSFPFLFVFGQKYCSVFSVVEQAWVDEFPIVNCRHSCFGEKGGHFFAAGKDTIWLFRTSKLTHQLASLVDKGKTGEAFSLLHAKEPDLSSPHFALLNQELHLKAGYHHLYGMRVEEGIRLLSSVVDPRCIFLHFPELIPPLPDHYSSGLQDLLLHGAAYPFFTYVLRTGTPLPTSVLLEGSVALPTKGVSGYWDEFAGSCCYDTEPLSAAWRKKRASSGEPAVPLPWDRLKETLLFHLLSLKTGGLNACWGRAVDYALLVLSLESGDHALSYKVANTSQWIAVEDVHDLLIEVGEFRLLALILFRKGMIKESERILCQHCYVLGTLNDSTIHLCTSVEDRLLTLEREKETSTEVLTERQKYAETTGDCFGVHLHSDPTFPSSLFRRYHYTIEYFCGAERITTIPFYGDPAVASSGGYLFPGGLHAVFHYCDHLDMRSLTRLPKECLATTMDEEGTCMLHHAVAKLRQLEADFLCTAERKTILVKVLQCVKLFASVTDNVESIFNCGIGLGILKRTHVDSDIMNLVLCAAFSSGNAPS